VPSAPAVAAAWLDARKGGLRTLGPPPILAAFDRLASTTRRLTWTTTVSHTLALFSGARGAFGWEDCRSILMP
jgi:hypothetical protein